MVKEGKKGLFSRGIYEECQFPIEEVFVASLVISRCCGDKKEEVPRTCQGFVGFAENEHVNGASDGENNRNV